MGAKYSSQAITGYNATPPADDGSQIASNVVEWDKHISKIGDPLKTLAEAINTALTNHFDQTLAEKTANYTVATSDFNRLIEMNVSGGGTLSLPALATAGGGFLFYAKNVHADSLTVDPNGAETVDGASTLSLGENEGALLMADNAEGDWKILSQTAVAASVVFAAGDEIIWRGSSVPSGWTRQSISNEALRIISTATGSYPSGGSVNFTTALSSARAVSVTVAGHALTVSEMPAHNHPIEYSSTAESTGADLRISASGATRTDVIGNEGGGAAHGHTGSSGSVNLAVKYRDFNIIRKN